MASASNWKYKDKRSGICFRDRVVDAIGRAEEWINQENPKTGERNQFPYAIAFTAESPHCIIKVHDICEHPEGDQEKPTYVEYIHYSIDGGAKQVMKRDRWYNLYKKLYDIEDSEEFPADEEPVPEKE